jgi:hypothetical protein
MPFFQVSVQVAPLAEGHLAVMASIRFGFRVHVQVFTQVAALLEYARAVTKPALEQHHGAFCDRISHLDGPVLACRNVLERSGLEIEDLTDAVACI